MNARVNGTMDGSKRDAARLSLKERVDVSSKEVLDSDASRLGRIRGRNG